MPVDSQDQVHAYQRSDPPIVVLSPDGTVVRAWHSGALADAHGIYIGPDGRVWLADS